jgi:hypothetical protein
MTKSKFTPGPWVAERATVGYAVYFWVRTNGQFIARTSHIGISEQEEQANAELMADAPELLNALRALCECTAPDPEEDRDLTRRVFADAERLLEKHGG